jgi:hypothetical protein
MSSRSWPFLLNVRQTLRTIAFSGNGLGGLAPAFLVFLIPARRCIVVKTNQQTLCHDHRVTRRDVVGSTPSLKIAVPIAF